MNPSSIHISAVIATCNRKKSVERLLTCLDQLDYPLREIILVDAGEERFEPAELTSLTRFPVHYLQADKSVCVQRNLGIAAASSPWILLCDDDVSFGVNYLRELVECTSANPHWGSLSGCWMESQDGVWEPAHPVCSRKELAWKYVFGLGIWGEIMLSQPGRWSKKWVGNFKAKGNRVSKAGWPINVDFSLPITTFPVYSLGASLVKKEWLQASLFDEVLDPHGIGDNYGVIAGFPVREVHVVMKLPVYHHKAEENRLKQALQYYRRVLALDYFNGNGGRRVWLLWSLFGNTILALWKAKGKLVWANLLAGWKILWRRNPYLLAKKRGRRIIEPTL